MRTLVARIVQTVERATVAECAEGLHWYETAHDHAREVGALRALPVSHGAGILAALSPACPWERNLADAYALARGDRHYAYTTYQANVAKATAIAEGENPDTVLGGLKVRAFWSLVSDPRNRESVCIDRHALAVAYGGPLTDAARSTFAGHPRLYARVSEAYRRAAEIVGASPAQTQAVAWVVYRGAISRPV